MEQERKRRKYELDRLTKETGERYSPARVSLESYEVRHAHQGEVLARIKALAARLPDAVKAGESIVLYGTPGTGKDHLLASLAHLATREHGLKVAWARGAEYYEGERRAVRGGGGGVLYLGLADVAVVTDPVLPTGDVSEWCLGRLLALVDKRYSDGRPTWLSANAPDLKSLKARLTAQLFDRLQDGGHLIPCYWPSYRAQRKST